MQFLYHYIYIQMCKFFIQTTVRIHRLLKHMGLLME